MTLRLPCLCWHSAVSAMLVHILWMSALANAIDLTNEKPECMRHEFSQRRLRYGNLERKAGNKGKLSFSLEPAEVLHIFFRIHPRHLFSEGYDPLDVPSASSLSLARSLDFLEEGMRNRTTISVFLNSNNDAEFFALQNWTRAIFCNRTLATMTYECPNGNVPSYNCMIDRLFRHRDEGVVHADDIIYFVEDDYLHHPEATSQLVDVISSHEPCFAVPYDYADRYYMSDFNDDDGKVTIVAGKDRHWRTCHSTTVTFSARFATLEYFFRKNMVPHPEDDYFASLAMTKAGASIVSPIPSLAAHIESYGNYLSTPTAILDSHEYVSLYHDWFDEAADLLHLVRQMEWNLWTLVTHYRTTANKMPGDIAG